METKIKSANVEELHKIGVDISLSDIDRETKSLYYALIETRLYNLDNSVMAEISDDVSVD